MPAGWRRCCDRQRLLAWLGAGAAGIDDQKFCADYNGRPGRRQWQLAFPHPHGGHIGPTAQCALIARVDIVSDLRRVIGLSAAFGAALNGTMLMPLIVLALNRVPGIGAGAATAIAACELAGIALYSLLAPRLVRRARRATTSAGLAALLLGQAATQYLSGIGPLAAARLTAGLGEGALFSLITSAVAGE